MQEMPLCMNIHHSVQEHAQYFCCKENCREPAFCCSEDCLQYSHDNHKQMAWSKMSAYIWGAKQNCLRKADLLVLEHQEKQERIVCEELKLILQRHESALIQCRRRQQLNKLVIKLNSCLQSRTSHRITGSDMAKLLKLVESDEIFTNKIEVDKIMAQRNQLVNDLLENFHTKIREYKHAADKILHPGEFIKMVPKIDLSTKYANKLIVKNERTVTIVQEQDLHFYPVFLRDQLLPGQYYEVELLEAAEKSFMIGVATENLKNCLDKPIHQQSLCIFGLGALFSGGTKQAMNFTFSAGDKVIVRNNRTHIQWLRNGNMLCTAPIQHKVKEKALFPVCWIKNAKQFLKISKLNFI